MEFVYKLESSLGGEEIG